VPGIQDPSRAYTHKSLYSKLRQIGSDRLCYILHRPSVSNELSARRHVDSVYRMWPTSLNDVAFLVGCLAHLVVVTDLLLNRTVMVHTNETVFYHSTRMESAILALRRYKGQIVTVRDMMHDLCLSSHTTTRCTIRCVSTHLKSILKGTR
jgi:hypothetical protein